MIGSIVSHYRILEKLGEGGMGVVYKATDTKLNRPVALKFLPSHVVGAEKDKERFVQEAQAAASLSHANICTIHGIEEFDGKQFIVMEYVEGQTLQERKQNLPLKQALEIGIQIADGLAAAHEKGIVHRDIKPENIMIRKDGRVQIMDFGLAKLRGASRLTKEGSTVGTAGYMSPEQVQGQDTDHRSDIFSLGVLLYEMLSGEPPFKGMHETAIAYEIVNVDSPPMSSIKPEIPPQLDAIVLDCLEKDPKERTQSAGQVALELKRYRRESSRQRASRITSARPVAHVPSSPEQGSVEDNGRPDSAQRKWSLTNVLFAAGIPIAAIAGYILASLAAGPKSEPVTVRATIEPPTGHRLMNDYGGDLALSPDGSSLVFSAVDSTGTIRLWLRELSLPDARPLSGTEGGRYPFWSPDGKEIAFFSNTKLRKIDLLGSPPLDIADVPQGRGGAWNPNGTIVVSPVIGEVNLFTVPAGGGELTQLTHFDSTAGFYPRFPSFLPDGDHFVYVGYAGGGMLPAPSGAFVGSLDGTTRQLPLRGTSNLIYSAGHLLYTRGNTLIAQAFDLSSLELAGDPVPIDKGIILYPARSRSIFTASPNDILVYVRSPEDAKGQIVWYDRKGRTSNILPGIPEYGMRLSPDDSKIAYHETDDQGNDDIWVYDLTRKIKSRFTFSPDPEVLPIWSPDGRTIYYNAVKGADWKVVAKAADGTGAEQEILIAIDTELEISDISPDGNRIVFSRQTLASGFDIVYSDLSQPGIIDTILSTRFHEYVATFSPDGKWIAYQSDASGRFEVYVRRVTRESEKWQVSTSGGVLPNWMPNGEIGYLSNGKVMVSRVTFEKNVPRFTIPSELFSFPNDGNYGLRDVTKDGSRFIGFMRRGTVDANTMSLIMNWHKLTEKK